MDVDACVFVWCVELRSTAAALMMSEIHSRSMESQCDSVSCGMSIVVEDLSTSIKQVLKEPHFSKLRKIANTSISCISALQHHMKSDYRTESAGQDRDCQQVESSTSFASVIHDHSRPQQKDLNNRSMRHDVRC